MLDEKNNIDLIKKTIIEGSVDEILSVITKAHHADIADAIEGLDSESRIAFFQKIKPELLEDIFEEIEQSVQIEVIQEMNPNKAKHLIDHMDLDDAADLLSELKEEDEDMADKIVRSLKEKQEVQKLLEYDENIAGGIMNPSFTAIPENLTVNQALTLFRKSEPPDRDFSYYVYIVNTNDELRGIINLRDLVLAPPDQKVRELRKENFVAVNVNTDQEEVARIISKYDLLAVPVIDDQNKMLGIVTVDDIVDVIEEEATEDLLKLSGTSAGEFDENDILTSRVWSSAKSRLRWLLLTMFGGLLSGSLLSYFTISFSDIPLSLPIIISFIPLLVGLGGNIGNQSATIMVRGLATGYIKTESIMSNIMREFFVSILIGLSIGFILFVGSLVIYKTMIYGSIIAVAIIINIILSASFGTLLPIFFTKINVDPAIASAPFISSSIDVAGLVIYFIVITSYLHFFL
ncbi:MAG: magnesium transporter [Candidatus Margulisbacteria bacterium GWF2_35_9]|nr:MAG: magnesium transporter [Candidatus Margulisbacteria bacterium GWF2_35_9]